MEREAEEALEEETEERDAKEDAGKADAPPAATETQDATPSPPTRTRSPATFASLLPAVGGRALKEDLAELVAAVAQADGRDPRQVFGPPSASTKSLARLGDVEALAGSRHLVPRVGTDVWMFRHPPDRSGVGPGQYTTLEDLSVAATELPAAKTIKPSGERGDEPHTRKTIKKTKTGRGAREPLAGTDALGFRHPPNGVGRQSQGSGTKVRSFRRPPDPAVRGWTHVAVTTERGEPGTGVLGFWVPPDGGLWVLRRKNGRKATTAVGTEVRYFRHPPDRFTYLDLALAVFH